MFILRIKEQQHFYMIYIHMMLYLGLVVFSPRTYSKPCLAVNAQAPTYFIAVHLPS